MTPTFSHLDYLINAVIEDDDYPTSAVEASAELAALRSELEAARAELAEYWTLRPAKCQPECYAAGWKAAQEAAANVASSHIIVGHSIQEPSMIAVIKQIRALQPPANCGGACNPLTPDAPITCQCDCGCSNHATVVARGLKLCGLCKIMGDELTDDEVEMINKH